MRVAPEAVQDSQSNGLVVFAANLTLSYRLLRNEGFDHVVHGENISTKCFKIFFSKNTKTNGRLGIISSKKILPRAVDRNRAKRLIREAYRHHSIKACCCDVVVLIRPFYQKDASQKHTDLSSLFGKVENRCKDL